MDPATAHNAKKNVPAVYSSEDVSRVTVRNLGGYYNGDLAGHGLPSRHTKVSLL